MEKIYKGEIQRLLPIFKAMAEGKTIQFATNGNSWIDIDGDEEGLFLDTLIDTPQSYRIKPEPKWRPFKDAEECWAEMQKHQPVGFMKFKDTESGYYMLTSIARGVGVGINDSLFSYDRVFDDYTFADGLPFGVKVEEDGVDAELPDIDSLIKKLTSDEYIEKKNKDVLGDDMADRKNKD